MNSYLALAIGISAEVLATTFLLKTHGLTKLGPTLLCIAAYAISLRYVSLAVMGIPTGIAYAIWSGIGIIIVTTLSWLIHGQELDPPALFGISLVAIGIVVLRVFSKVT